MLDFFTALYAAVTNERTFLEKVRFNSVCRVIIRRTANALLPLYFRCTSSKSAYRLHPETQTSGRLIVSLTTFPARIHKVGQVIETMLRQTHRPDKIILWLSKEQFRSLSVLPQDLLQLQERGLEIQLRDGDLRSHKKYYYALTEYPDDFLVTIDDDIYYTTHLLEYLWEKHLEVPQAVVANYTHNRRYDATGALLPYMQWENNAKAGEHLFLCSGGGTLFPPHCLYPEATRIDLAQRLCPQADDIWLNTMVQLAGTPLVHTPYHYIPLPVLNKHNPTLCQSNLAGGNDQQLGAIKAHYAL